MTNPNTQPLAQDFALAAQVPDAAHFFHDPNLTRLDDGALLRGPELYLANEVVIPPPPKVSPYL